MLWISRKARCMEAAVLPGLFLSIVSTNSDQMPRLYGSHIFVLIVFPILLSGTSGIGNPGFQQRTDYQSLRPFYPLLPKLYPQHHGVSVSTRTNRENVFTEGSGHCSGSILRSTCSHFAGWHHDGIPSSHLVVPRWSRPTEHFGWPLRAPGSEDGTLMAQSTDNIPSCNTGS